LFTVNSTPHTQRRALRLIAGWGALFLFVGVASPLGLGLAALAGALDRSHHLSVQGGRAGLQLVLQHGGCRAAHHHGVLARALTVFARPASATNPDHVIQFRGSDHFSRQVQCRAAAPETPATPDLALDGNLLPAPRRVARASIPTHPPPDPNGQLRCRGSTLWLI
jgi:hypothetical protein